MNNNTYEVDLDAILSEFSSKEAEPESIVEEAPLETEMERETVPVSELKPEPIRKVVAAQPAPERPAPAAAKKPAARRKASPVLSVFFALVALLVLFWVGKNIHPNTGTVISSTKETKLDLVSKLNVYMNNAAADALSNVAYIKKIYTIPESDTVAPKPDQSRFGVTTDPAEVQAIVEEASALLDGQTLIWNPDIERKPNSEIEYYYDETILAIAWKEVINRSVCTFLEVKLAHGSQLRRAITEDTYGSSVRTYASNIAKSVNAVCAINGDFYTFRNYGITVYQRQLYRCAPRHVDTCYFTAAGEMIFSGRGDSMTEEEAKKFISDNDIVFSVAFGPILVDNGVLQENYHYAIGEVENIYSRSAIGWVDDLHYLGMNINTEDEFQHVATINQAAKYMYDKNCVNAYALDGGQTAVIIMNGDTVNRPDYGNERSVSDIIYFATAIPEGEGSQ